MVDRKMTNDNGLVDEYEKIQKLKAEIDQKEEELKKQIIELAKQNNTEILFGINKKCIIKEYERVVYPEDKSQIISLIKHKGLYDRFSMLNYMGLSSAINKGEIDKDITDLTKKEKTWRLSLKDK